MVGLRAVSYMLVIADTGMCSCTCLLQVKPPCCYEFRTFRVRSGLSDDPSRECSGVTHRRFADMNLLLSSLGRRYSDTLCFVREKSAKMSETRQKVHTSSFDHDAVLSPCHALSQRAGLQYLRCQTPMKMYSHTELGAAGTGLGCRVVL